MKPTIRLGGLFSGANTTFFNQFRSWFGIYLWFLPFMFLISFYPLTETSYGFIPVLSLIIFTIASIILGVSLMHRWGQQSYQEFLPADVRRADSVGWGFKKAWPYFWTQVLMGLIFLALVIVPALLIFYGDLQANMILQGVGIVLAIGALIPVFILSLYWMFSEAQVVFKQTNYLSALKASKALVKGNWWRVLWFLILILLVVMIVSSFINFLFLEVMNTWWGLLLNNFFSTLVSLYFAAFVMHLFFGLLEKKGELVKSIVVSVKQKKVSMPSAPKASVTKAPKKKVAPKKKPAKKKAVKKKKLVKKTPAKRGRPPKKN